MRPYLFLLLPLLIGCAVQRAQDAEDAKTQMVGMSKEDVFACMGPPTQKSSEGKTEIWSYPSSNGRVDSLATAGAYGTAGNNSASAFGVASGFSEKRFCVVNLVMASGKVKAVNYNGPTGGVFTKGEQCAYAIENCVKHDTTASPAPAE
jgi:hypothetical protein